MIKKSLNPLHKQNLEIAAAFYHFLSKPVDLSTADLDALAALAGKNLLKRNSLKLFEVLQVPPLMSSQTAETLQLPLFVSSQGSDVGKILWQLPADLQKFLAVFAFKQQIKVSKNRQAKLQNVKQITDNLPSHTLLIWQLSKKYLIKQQLKNRQHCLNLSAYLQALPCYVDKLSLIESEKLQQLPVTEKDLIKLNFAKLKEELQQLLATDYAHLQKAYAHFLAELTFALQRTKLETEMQKVNDSRALRSCVAGILTVDRYAYSYLTNAIKQFSNSIKQWQKSNAILLLCLEISQVDEIRR